MRAMGRTEDEAAAAGDEVAFARVTERHRGELRVHCYRMLGSYDESEDLVQETFLRAWRRRATWQGRASFRAWLYRIATNACLDHLDRRPRRPSGSAGLPPVVAVPWLQPYPDRLWEPAAAPEAEPEAVLIRRETIELAFLAALQHLPPRQRAVLVLRDVLGWSAADTAAALDTTAAAVNSALQRARPAVRELLPERREEWPSGPVADRAERELLERWVAAIEEADDDALRALLREDARVAHQAGAGGHTGAEPTWYAGRERILAAWAPLLHPAEPLAVRALPTWVNRQPALGTYVGLPGSVERVGIGLTVLTLAGGQVSEVASFDAALLPACGLPARL